MEITITPTELVVRLESDGPRGIAVGVASGLPARVWEGTTGGGLRVKVLVALIGVEDSDQPAFEAELAAVGGSTIVLPVEPADHLRWFIDPGNN